MLHDERSRELLEEWRSGNQNAATELFNLYSGRLLRLANQTLSPKLARRVDGEDVVQSVFRSFFRRSADGEFQLGSSQDIWRLLVWITVAKARGQARKHTAGRRNVDAEVLSADAWSLEQMTREPGPDDVACLVEQVDFLLKDAPPQHGEILGLALAGHSRTEIAEELDISRQTVYRILWNCRSA